jgi:hypothetical protein
MWDLTWLKYGGQPRRLISLPLILESALDRYADLEKLLTARAEHRIVIFQGKVPFRDNRYFEQFATQVRECGMTQPGDRYLFLCFDRNDRKFKFRVFVARADLLLYSQ